MSVGSKTKQVTVQSRDPWGPAQPLLNTTLGGIGAYLNNGKAFQTYGGPTVAGMSDNTRAGLDAMATGTGAGTSMGYLNKVLAGDYLSAGNPYMEDVKKSVMSSVMPGINATFARAGMTGSTTHQGSLSRGLADAIAPHLFNAYESERGRMTSAASLLPQLDQLKSQGLLGAGQLREAYDQRALDDAKARWEADRTAGLRPYAEIWPMLSGIAGLGGTATGTTTGAQTPPLTQSILGGLMMGGSLLGGPLTTGLGSLMGWAPTVTPTR